MRAIQEGSGIAAPKYHIMGNETRTSAGIATEGTCVAMGNVKLLAADGAMGKLKN